MPPPAATSASAPPPIAIVLPAPACARLPPGDVVVVLAVGVVGVVDGVDGVVDGVEGCELGVVDGGVLLGLVGGAGASQETAADAETGAFSDCARIRFCD